MANIRTQARGIARILDGAFTVPGTDIRFGLDPLIGLIPGIGDLIGSGLSAYIVFLAARAGASPAVLARMLANIAIDTLVGAIPILGDIFDFGWKANQRNVALLEKYLDAPDRVSSVSWTVLAVIFIALVALLALVVWGAIAAIRALS